MSLESHEYRSYHGDVTLRLELRHYETVVAIVELGSMTAAAKRLHTTQSALSHRLADAERRLGVKLFDRGAERRLKPTRAGLVVHQSASRALAELERSESMLRTDDADVHASWLNGGFESDLPFTLDGRIGKRSARGILGDGGPELELQTVNGSISIR